MALEVSVGRRRSLSPGLGSFDVWHHLVFVVVCGLVLTPLTFLVLGSVSSARLPTAISFDKLTLAHYLRVYLDPNTYELLSNTVIYVLGSVLIGISLATVLAWLVERSNLPGKILIYAGVPMTLAVPGMLQAMAWVLLLSPRIGFFNRFFMAPGQETGPFNIYSMPGMVFLEGLRLVPTAFLMLVPLMRAMDPALEEAAAVAGVRPLSMIRKVTLRLLAPGLFAVMIYQAMTALEVFEIPGILGLPAGIYVFSTKIYSLVHTATLLPSYGQANALAMVYVMLAVVTTYFYIRMIGRSERYTVITGKGYRPRQQDLGRWKYPMLAVAAGYIFLAAILPFAVFAFTSFLPYLQTPSLEVIQSFTMKNYRFLGTYGEVGTAITNTVVMVIVTATSVSLLSFFASLIIVRSKFWGRKLLDQLAFTPHAIPGIVMGLSFFWVFARTDWLPVYGTIWAMCIGFTAQFMPYGTRSYNAGLLQIHKELEEAAYVSGARPWRTLLRIFFPLVLPTLAGVWIWVVLHAVRVAGMPLMLYQGSQNQVLSILVWNMWDEGYVPAVAAIGTLLMGSLLILTLVVRLGTFRRHVIEEGST